MEKEFAVGIDIGGTNTVFGIVDRRGHIINKDRIKTYDYPKIDEYIQAVGDSVLKLIAEDGGKEHIAGVGIGAPNGNYFSGNMEHAPNLLMWGDIVPLSTLLSKKLELPVCITNDGNAAAIDEMTYGIARGMNDFIIVTLGTGLGGGIVTNGQLLYGHHGFAGELGHTCAIPEGRLCNCGNRGEFYVPIQIISYKKC